MSRKGRRLRRQEPKARAILRHRNEMRSVVKKV